jgi:hypothetical protein
MALNVGLRRTIKRKVAAFWAISTLFSRCTALARPRAWRRTLPRPRRWRSKARGWCCRSRRRGASVPWGREAWSLQAMGGPASYGSNPPAPSALRLGSGPQHAQCQHYRSGDLTATGVKPSATFKMMHYRKSLLPCGLWGIMSKAERASLDKYRDRDLHVSGGRLTRSLAMSSGRNGASSVEVLFSLQRRVRSRR